MPRNSNSLSLGPAGLILVGVLVSSAPLAAAPPEQAELSTPIALDTPPELDRAIEQRLRAIYAQLDPLQDIEVEVEAGVVHLRGQVRSLEAVDRAQSIAERVEGVAAVTQEIQQEAQLRRRLQPVFDQMRQRTNGWLAYLPLMLAAAAVVAVAWMITRLLARRSEKRGETSTYVRQFVGQMVRAGILAIGIAIALELLGATALLGALLGTAGVIGIVIGVAFKNIGETYLASILLSLRRPFDPHDLVLIDDREGSVVGLTSRATMLMTIDGNTVRIPNAKVFNATIVNFTRNPHRRFSFKLGVAFEAELRRVQELAVATLLDTPGVLSDPAPACLIEEFGDSAMTISVAGWVDQRHSDWLKVSSEAKRMIKTAFDRAGIEVPEPSFRIRTTTYEACQPDVSEPKTEPSLDVTPDDHLDRQVDEERAARAENDLLREGGRSE